jgi:hypothetical protein
MVGVMKKFVASIAVALAALQAPANAGVILSGTNNDPQDAVSGSTYITFEDVVVGTTTSFTSIGFSFTGTGTIFQGDSGAFIAPKSDSTHYLGIGATTETLTLSADYTQFGVYWGSIDSVNAITFLNNGATVYTLAGSGVPGVNFTQPTNSAVRNIYVNFAFTEGLAFDEVRFTSTSAGNFEIDNLALNGQLAGAAPELSTWAMMLLGFGGIGFLAWRRTRKVPAAA